jgi:uncharacterized SAM-binding protein YcdF (DUF218 family)
MKNKMKVIMQRIRKTLAGILLGAGILAALMVLLAFTTVPFYTWYGMAMEKAGVHRPPDYIVLLGGGGMPSESGLMRSWYAAKAAAHFTRAKVIIALPGDTGDPLSSIQRMKEELVLRGISPERILFEDSGANTRAQALNIQKRISNNEYRITNIEGGDLPATHPSRVTRHASLLLITSPEHLPRAYLTFQKACFRRLDGLPAFEAAIESDITFNPRKLGGRLFIPDIGSNITLRYQFWTQMDYEWLVLREWVAMGYYWLKGWV